MNVFGMIHHLLAIVTDRLEEGCYNVSREGGLVTAFFWRIAADKV
jgi:hypothetical protein